MTTENLLLSLKQKHTLLPQEIMEDTSLAEVSRSVIHIFENHRDEMVQDENFKANFTELVNYVYLMALDKKPEQRNKNIFNSNLTTFLLNTA